MTREEEICLRADILRRAALGFEQAEHWPGAAECWVELGEHVRAGVLYTRGNNPARAATAMLDANRFTEALDLCRQWEESLPDGDILNRIKALLLRAACHLLGAEREPDHERLSRKTGAAAHRQARDLLESETDRGGVFASRCWILLGDFGARMKRFDIVQEGYEKALAHLEQVEVDAQKAEIVKNYLITARAQKDISLINSLEEQLAEWIQI